MDDAHTSENYIAGQWTVRISRSDELLFKAVAAVLKGVLNETDYDQLTGDGQSIEDVTSVDKVQAPQLVEMSSELRAVIAANIGEDEQKYR